MSSCVQEDKDIPKLLLRCKLMGLSVQQSAAWMQKRHGKRVTDTVIEAQFREFDQTWATQFPIWPDVQKAVDEATEHSHNAARAALEWVHTHGDKCNGYTLFNKGIVSDWVKHALQQPENPVPQVRRQLCVVCVPYSVSRVRCVQCVRACVCAWTQGK